MLVLQGSHRKSGSTAAIANLMSKHLGAEVLNLSEASVAHFSYEGPTADDFEALIRKLIEHKEVIWATPIYWYTMSGVMKVFMDRISDLLKWNKELGRRLRGIKMHVISVSGHDDAPVHFTYPFEMTAEYLGMEFGSYFHVWGDEGALSDESKKRAINFIEKLK